MDGLELLRKGRSELAVRGLASRTRINPNGSVCALGALDAAIGVWDSYQTYMSRGCCRWEHESSPEYQEAVAALVELLVGQKPDSDFAQFAVAGYSNSHTLDEVLAWFDNAILHKELERPASITEGSPDIYADAIG